MWLPMGPQHPQHPTQMQQNPLLTKRALVEPMNTRSSLQQVAAAAAHLSSGPMRSVRFSRQGGCRPAAIDTLDVLDAKLDGNWTQDGRRDDSLKNSSENLSLVPCFVLGTGERALRSPWMNDLRYLNPWVGCKALMCNALQVAATALLPLLGPVFMSSGAVK